MIKKNVDIKGLSTKKILQFVEVQNVKTLKNKITPKQAGAEVYQAQISLGYLLTS